MAEAADSFRALFPEQYLKKFTEEGIRPDARSFSAARETSFNLGKIRTADGSSMVQFGDTTVVAGVTLSTFRPTVGCPDIGKLNVAVELGAVCSNRFSGGRPSDQAMSISEYVGRTLRNAEVIDLSDLIIKKGAASFALDIAVTCLNYDGNMEDAALMAAVLALADTKLPAVVVHETGEVVECEGQAKRLKMRKLPLGLTHVVLEGSGGKLRMLMDPTAEEEDEAHGSVSVVVTFPFPLKSKSDLAEAAAAAPIMLHKPGGLGLRIDDLKELIAAARTRASQVLPQILTALS